MMLEEASEEVLRDVENVQRGARDGVGVRRIGTPGGSTYDSDEA